MRVEESAAPGLNLIETAAHDADDEPAHTPWLDQSLTQRSPMLQGADTSEVAAVRPL